MARAGAVAHAGAAHRVRAGACRAVSVGILAVGNVGAHTGGDQLAGLARAGTRGVAAHALDAVTVGALRIEGAAAAVRLGAARLVRD